MSIKTTKTTQEEHHHMSTPEDCPFKNIVIPNPTQLPPTRQQETIDIQMNTRVGKLEGVVETLTRDIQEVSHNVGILGNNINGLKDILSDSLAKIRDGFNNQLSEVTDRLTSSAKPQWQTISAFVALAITLLGMAGAVVGLIMSGQSDQVASLKQDTAVITDRMFANQYEKGKSDAFASNVANHLTNLDSTLQKEMSLLNATTESKITGLDSKIQLEIEAIRKNIEEGIQQNKNDLANIRDWRLEHVTETATLQGLLRAKQEMIEKQLSELNDRQWNYRHDRLSAFEKLQIDTTFTKDKQDAQP
jgi:hypothetical protein